ncbi:DUF5694 domain-containing protein [Salinibacter ruber]|uniref:DUF5694 domain-containing protein n=1 Tax=Salinibacter ruber TaxID=146919 RepID=UPI003C6DBE73
MVRHWRAWSSTRQSVKLHRRTLRIVASLTRVAEPGDRILLIYRANHASYFREFIGDHPRMTVVDPLDHLRPRGRSVTRIRLHPGGQWSTITIA